MTTQKKKHMCYGFGRGKRSWGDWKYLQLHILNSYYTNTVLPMLEKFCYVCLSVSCYVWGWSEAYTKNTCNTQKYQHMQANKMLPKCAQDTKPQTANTRLKSLIGGSPNNDKRAAVAVAQKKKTTSHKSRRWKFLQRSMKGSRTSAKKWKQKQKQRTAKEITYQLQHDSTHLLWQ